MMSLLNAFDPEPVNGKDSPFGRELMFLINKYSKENESNTPDRILAQFLLHSLGAFNVAVDQREAWYGRETAATRARRTAIIENMGGYTNSDIGGGIYYAGEFVLQQPTDTDAGSDPNYGIDAGDEHQGDCA